MSTLANHRGMLLQDCTYRIDQRQIRLPQRVWKKIVAFTGIVQVQAGGV